MPQPSTPALAPPRHQTVDVGELDILDDRSATAEPEEELGIRDCSSGACTRSLRFADPTPVIVTLAAQSEQGEFLGLGAFAVVPGRQGRTADRHPFPGNAARPI